MLEDGLDNNVLSIIYHRDNKMEKENYCLYMRKS